MRAFQFWILIIISTVISGLMIKQIFLTRQLIHAQRTFVDSQQAVSEGSSFEQAWKQLAMRLYQAGRDDPAVISLLTSDNVAVRTTKNPTGAPGASSAAPASTAPAVAPLTPAPAAKPAAGPAHPATP